MNEVNYSAGLTAGVTLGVVGALLLFSLAVLGLCMLPRCPLRKVYSPYKEVAPDPDVVRMDEERGEGARGSAAGETQRRAELEASNAPLMQDDETKE